MEKLIGWCAVRKNDFALCDGPFDSVKALLNSVRRCKWWINNHHLYIIVYGEVVSGPLHDFVIRMDVPENG